nr:hypothetical protein Iba_chr08eCG10370 [Ipomoea batatas]
MGEEASAEQPSRAKMVSSRKAKGAFEARGERGIGDENGVVVVVYGGDGVAAGVGGEGELLVVGAGFGADLGGGRRREKGEEDEGGGERVEELHCRWVRGMGGGKRGDVGEYSG